MDARMGVAAAADIVSGQLEFNVFAAFHDLVTHYEDTAKIQRRSASTFLLAYWSRIVAKLISKHGS
jgi:hypothetical protein